jgi:uncharacterized protein YgbK (DUF1537 family)
MLEVLSRRRGRVLALVAPAFPATGRTTRGGVVHVSGERLLAHGSDGDVVGLLGRGGLRAVSVDVAETPTLRDRLEQAHAAGLDAVVVDAMTDDDLRAVVTAARTARVPCLLVGSGGLTRPLADDGDGTTAPEPEPEPEPEPVAGATLVVVGSYAAVSRGQRARLLDHGVAPLVLDDASPGTLGAALRRGPVVLSPDPDAPVHRSEAPKVADRLAQVAASVLDEVGTLVLTGGETARAVLRAAGVDRYLVTCEVEPGVVRGHVPDRRLDLVTKAGGFGDPDTLLRCLPPSVPATDPPDPTQEGSQP